MMDSEPAFPLQIIIASLLNPDLIYNLTSDCYSRLIKFILGSCWLGNCPSSLTNTQKNELRV